MNYKQMPKTVQPYGSTALSPPNLERTSKFHDAINWLLPIPDASFANEGVGRSYEELEKNIQKIYLRRQNWGMLTI